MTKKLLQETTTRQDTQQDTRQEDNERHTNKTRNTRQSATSANHAKPQESKAKNEARVRRLQQ
jgi:hypothetical protein